MKQKLEEIKEQLYPNTLKGTRGHEGGKDDK